MDWFRYDNGLRLERVKVKDVQNQIWFRMTSVLVYLTCLFFVVVVVVVVVAVVVFVFFNLWKKPP